MGPGDRLNSGGSLDRGEAIPKGRAGQRWYAVFTQNFREQRAARHLSEQGFRTYLAQYEKTVRHARRLQTVKRPLFPRYVFVSLDLSKDRWRAVNGTFGAVGLIMEGALPRPIPHGVVEALVAATDPGGLVRYDAALMAGDRVQLLTGPFAEMVGELLSIDEAGRVRVLLDMMGSKRSVRAQVGSLAPAG